MDNFIKAVIEFNMFMLALLTTIFAFLFVLFLMEPQFELAFRSLLCSLLSLLLRFLLESLEKYL